MAKEKIGALGVDVTGMKLLDASGLASGNKISAVTVSQLLLKIRKQFKFLIDTPLTTVLAHTKRQPC